MTAMMTSWVLLPLLLVSLWPTGGAGGTDHTDVKHLRQELERCQDTLLKHTMDQLAETTAGSSGLVDKACSSLGSMFSSSQGSSSSSKHLRSLTSALLATLKLDMEQQHHNHQQDRRLEKDLTFSIASQDLLVLRRFVLYNEGKPTEIQAIIQSSLLVRESWSKSDFLRLGGGGSGGQTTHMKPKYALLIMGCCVLCLLVLVVYLQVRLWQLVLPILLYIFLHVWIGEYYTAVARKEAVLAKLGPNLVNCRLERTGYVNAVSDFFTGLWNGKTDPCEEYYIATMVDPFFEVSPIEVFNQVLCRLMAVLGGVGAALGNFYTNLLAPLPLLWKVPILALATILSIVLILVVGRYSISSIFFTIGPDRRKKKERPSLSTSASSPAELSTLATPQPAVAAATPQPAALPSSLSSPALPLLPYPPAFTEDFATNSTSDENAPRSRQGWRFLLHK